MPDSGIWLVGVLGSVSSRNSSLIAILCVSLMLAATVVTGLVVKEIKDRSCDVLDINAGINSGKMVTYLRQDYENGRQIGPWMSSFDYPSGELINAPIYRRKFPRDDHVLLDMSSNKIVDCSNLGYHCFHGVINFFMPKSSKMPRNWSFDGYSCISTSESLLRSTVCARCIGNYNTCDFITFDYIDRVGVNNIRYSTYNTKNSTNGAVELILPAVEERAYHRVSELGLYP